MKNELLRSKEASDLLGLKHRSMHVLEKRGLIHSIRDWAGHRRFKRQDVLALRKSLFPEIDEGAEPKPTA